MSPSPVYDVAVVGAGVVGAAIAAELSQLELRVVWFEAAHDVAEGATKANSAILCSGFDISPETLEFELVAESSPAWEATCAALDVPFARIGALSLAFAEEELERLDAVAAQATRGGADCEVVAGERLRRLTQGMAPTAIRALHVPAEAIVDPIRLTIGWAELAVLNGVDLRCSTPVTGFRRAAEGRITEVVTPTGAIGVGSVVNAAGLHADEIAAAAGSEELRMWPRRGEFLLVDRAIGAGVPSILASLPTAQTRGVLAVPTTNGTTLLGPSAEDGVDRGPAATDEETLGWILSQAQRLIPGVRRDHVIKVFAGLRPASDRPYRIERSTLVSNLVHAAGIRSTGVSSSPAVARLVRRLLRDAGIDAPQRARRRVALAKVPRIAELPSAEIAAVVARDPGYRTVICACEHVSAAEVRAACHGPVPAGSLDAVRKRTRAMAGRCQGAYCQAGVGFILSMERSLEPWAVPKGGPGSLWGCAADG